VQSAVATVLLFVGLGHHAAPGGEGSDLISYVGLLDLVCAPAPWGPSGERRIRVLTWTLGGTEIVHHPSPHVLQFRLKGLPCGLGNVAPDVAPEDAVRIVLVVEGERPWRGGGGHEK
jgi:hypothetical protein